MATSAQDSSQAVSLTDRLAPNASFKRKSYTREEKIRVLDFYKQNGRNLYKTCQKFDLNSKNVLRWIKDEGKIRESKRGTRLENLLASELYSYVYCTDW